MFLGIDLGGTKIEAAVLDTRGQVLFRERVATPQGNYDATLDAISVLVAWAESQLGIFDSIGIGTPGAISVKTGLMKNCNSTCLNGRALTDDLQHRLNRKIIQANDADCFTLSEAIDGAARGKKNVFGVILGTGVGGGLVLNQHLVQGVNRIAGEWGHNPMPADLVKDFKPRPCYCGRHNCIETFLSGPGLSQTHSEVHGLRNITPDTRLIASQAMEGEKRAEQTLQIYSLQLASALAGVINIVDPDIIVLGGGISNIKLVYTYIQNYLDAFVFSDSIMTRILPPEFGDSSGVRGAAWLSRL
ncbi:ROK family protein [Oceanospirillum sediminis]|uniref:ROK family protein n=1 Tax=Oceanospirillum sediminis TaxID=2760088 RepID=A0A839IKI9_9GAMM|nr:ROK family protein [Oceanospirillum sediminis]MBB1485705.1 ROK family protein [Oceanospirillum sediminis]